ncbi:MAG: DUF2121 domain-containing protein [Methanobrevibacter boviskoreani]|jgi:hypothetical protein|uniref:MJ0548 connectase family domain-containing protein n=1 Tax=Methanobrevibacter TaxID=2172 RepID=UPI0003348816|nr:MULTISPECIES: DUF2121 domain-containing protein [Methanobrevibacter]AGN17064.1 hypothetical protein Abm4_1181 [Methanobrevibacter sp. AbM4]MCI6774324.1 DUF2121 domain-containing protein [Methanobrevibacter boviskoreani]MCI6930592.1 DUF2121 domain-containing protein [Methanobrevibacter boviskoreani]MDD6257479.1 DUF2121 domain-containing protein [Methanobrevibacter boviskoreani]
MSIIIAYIGRKGCVMASDKRRIAYFGDKDNREKLEEELYSGNIRNDEELYKEAAKLGIDLKISDDAKKIKSIGNAVMGEVSSKTTREVRRRRIYGTTNGYQIIELIGSELKNKETGSSGIIIFGNKIAKQMANSLIKQRWKSSISLKYTGDIFEEIIKEIAEKTPSVGKNVDVIIGKDSKLTKTTAQKYLDETETRDIKVLEKYRQKLAEDLEEQRESIEVANKIINKGTIGYISKIEGKMLNVKLTDKVNAYDTNLKKVAGSNEEVIMFLDKDTEGNEIKEADVSSYAKVNDKVVIKNENLCIDKNNIPLNCGIILCNE